VLEDGSYREAARRLQEAIQQMDGPGRAAELIEEVVERQSVRV
jgi:UDP:flavonoid glycosyltransferase YjiC (YdhE family)